MRDYRGEDITNGSMILKFTATWCSPCKALGITLEKINQQYQDLIIYNVDITVEENNELIKMFDVRTIPFTTILVNGKTVGTFDGNVPEGEIINMLKLNNLV